MTIVLSEKTVNEIISILAVANNFLTDEMLKPYELTADDSWEMEDFLRKQL